MFRIGEFSQIARVSGRLLRHYDSLGLLQPEHVDPQTGYRYYSARQLPRLNRILALKELGLSLEQIGRLIDDKISADEIRGMLILKRAESKQALHAEQARLRQIESRLKQIEEQGFLPDYDIAVKSVPAQPFLSVRAVFPGMDEAVAMLRTIAVAGGGRVPHDARERLMVVAHSDFDDENLDLEIGFGLRHEITKRVVLPNRVEMLPRELPAITTCAAAVRSGPAHESHLAFGALGLWMEANRYRIAGPCREIFLETPFQTPGDDHAVIEIQFPVTKAA